MLWQIGNVILKAVGLFESAQAVAGDPGPTPTADGTSITLTNPLGCDNISCVINRLIDVVFTISIPVVSLMVLIGGFQILVAAGDPEKFKTGRKTILYAAVGFTVILAAKAVVLILQDLFS